MARQVKVFSGSVSSALTIYTVPAGRIAKVEIAYLLAQSNDGSDRSTYDYLIRGTIKTSYNNFLGASNTGVIFPGASIYSGAASMAVGENTLCGRLASGMGVTSTPRYVFLNAGETVRIVSSYSSLIEYNILVVEEF